MSKLSSSWTSQMLCRVEELLFTISGVMRSVHGMFFSRSTFVGSLHVLFFKHQVVTLYRSRVKLHPENNLTLWSHLTFMIAFNLQETKQTNVTMTTKAQISQRLKTQFVFFPTMMSPFRSCAGSSMMHTWSLWPGPMWLKQKQQRSLSHGARVWKQLQIFTESSN